jgi:BlaI family transcriptional regulator, penicillinase repressor
MARRAPFPKKATTKSLDMQRLLPVGSRASSGVTQKDGRSMRQKRKAEFLTEVELEFMTCLWTLGEGTVRDVLGNLAPDRNLAYTSGATIMRILEQKQFVDSKKRGKSLVYRALLSKEDYQMRSLKNLSAKLFDDTPVSLVARLVDDYGLSEEALGEIRDILDRRLKDVSD